MAPNIKEINDALLSLDLSNHVLTAKYAPLTSEVASSSSADTASAEQQVQANASTKLQQQHDLKASIAVESSLETNQDETIDQASYWDMPHRPELTADEKRQELIDDILRQEEIRQMFTANHIVANLKKEFIANKSEDDVVVTKSKNCSDEVEGYWDMPAGGDNVLVVETEAQPAVETAVESSLLEETETTIPACLTTDHIVSNLISEGERLSSSTPSDAVVVAPHVHDPTHPHYNYWDWDTSPQATNYEAKRRALIEQILEEERAREMTSAGHVIKTILERAQAANSANASTSSTANDADESYWSFTPRSTDPADTIHAPHARDPNHPLADYWTWDTSPKSADEQRQVLIDWILREEAARQATCMDAVVQELIQSASASNVGTGNKTAVEESKESAEGYWDW